MRKYLCEIRAQCTDIKAGEGGEPPGGETGVCRVPSENGIRKCTTYINTAERTVRAVGKKSKSSYNGNVQESK